MVIKTAVMGKLADSDGDTLDDPTSDLEYDLFAWKDFGTPTVVHTTVRETHGVGATAFQESYAYSGGLGQVILQKAKAEPGLAPKRNGSGDLEFDGDELLFEDTSPDPRWVGSGRTLVDNKGNPRGRRRRGSPCSPRAGDRPPCCRDGPSSDRGRAARARPAPRNGTSGTALSPAQARPSRRRRHTAT